MNKSTHYHVVFFLLLAFLIKSNNLVAQCSSGSFVQTTENETRIVTCSGDALSDIVSFSNTGTPSANYTYVLTDVNNIILEILDGDNYDFENSTLNLCRIFGFSYTGAITASIGDLVYSTNFSDACYYISSNAIEITKGETNGGSVATSEGLTEEYVCLGDFVADYVSFTTTSTSVASYVYLVTDENNIILEITSSFSNFSNAPVGICRVWGLSYTGTLMANVGMDAAISDLSNSCFELSENFITIDRNSTFGGMINSSAGVNPLTLCTVGDNSELTFTNNSTAQASYAYVITDNANNILEIVDGDSHDFSGAPDGTCRIFGFSYTGEITAGIGELVYTTNFSDGCYRISTNGIIVNRISDGDDCIDTGGCNEDGGTVSTIDGETMIYTCADDNNSDEVIFTNTGSSAGDYVYIVTNEENIIIDLSGTGTIDFENLSTPVCRVWGAAYTGNFLAIQGDNAAEVDLSDDCFDLSDTFVEVIKTDVDGGTVALPSGETTRFVCTGDGEDDIVLFTNTSNSSAPYTYLVTDENNIILAVVLADNLNFESLDPGTCRVWGVSYTGTLSAMVGDNAATIDLSDNCFELSENFIEIIRTAANGATIATTEDETSLTLCVSDGTPDEINFTTTSNSGAQYTYLITDEENNILALADNNTFDFEDGGTGICRVWGLSYTGDLIFDIGDNAAEVELSDDCFDLSTNFINVNRTATEGGEVATANGEALVYTCPADGNEDAISFSTTSTATAEYIYLITDTDATILSIINGDSNDFEDAPVGVCLVWGLSYSGNLTAQVGDNAAEIDLSDACFSLSSNFIEVIRDNPEGGEVATSNDETVIAICVGDDEGDIIAFTSTTNSNSQYLYVITDEDNIILSVADGSSNDFSDAPTGVCRVWGLSYTGNIVAEIGDNAAEVDLSDDCFDLSSNFIEVSRTAVDGGEVAMPNGETIRYVCQGDGNADIVQFMNNSTATDAEYMYVITDNANVILNITSEDNGDFDSAQAGTCRVWGVSYTGVFLAELGDNAAEVDLSDACFTLSSNYIEVIRDNPKGGTISNVFSQETVYTCPDDGIADIVTFLNDSDSNAPYAYVITDEENNILDQVGDGNSYDFENGGIGICRVWGLSYTGNLTGVTGDNVNDVDLSDDCFELSENFITVVRTTVEGGLVATAEGDMAAELCVGDGVADEVDFVSNTSSDAPYAYIITDNNNFIINIPFGSTIDFDIAPAGNCRIWGVSYTGNLMANPGALVVNTMISDGCYELSSNFVEITRKSVDGGFVSLPEGPTIRFTCPGDGNADVVNFATNTPNPSPYAFVITDENNIIEAIADGNNYDFEDAGVGVSHVWGVSYTGNLTAEVGEDITTALLSDDCFLTSVNFIQIIRGTPEGGMVTTAFGESSVELCVIDGVPDPVTFTTTSTSAAGYRFIITDENNTVLGLPAFNVHNFEGNPPGTCRVWGVSFTGNLIVQPGEDASAVPLSDECYELSEDFVTINRFDEGGPCLFAKIAENLESTESTEENSMTDEVLLFDEEVNDAIAAETIFAITLSPNPATSLLQVSLNNEGETEKASLQIFNIQGQAVFQSNFETIKGLHTFDIDINHLPKGMYVLAISQSNQLLKENFVKN